MKRGKVVTKLNNFDFLINFNMNHTIFHPIITKTRHKIIIFYKNKETLLIFNLIIA
jgi:hypothetical protein